MRTRSTVMAQHGVVATGHPLASAAGLQVLRSGGNAMDAALAAAGVLGVVQPMMSGLGGDTFLLWLDGRTGTVTALNGSGAAPLAATREHFLGRGFQTMPLRGMASASVPGAVDAMVTALERWGSGRCSLADLLAPAIAYAEKGAPVAPRVAEWFAESAEVLARFPSSARVFLPQGRPPRAGEVLVQRDLGASLRLVAREGRRAFYEGALAEAIVRYSTAHDGLFTLEDFRRHRSEVVEPLATTYRGWTVYTTPPPSQGIILLLMLNLLAQVPRERLRWGDPEGVVLAVAAKQAAFADRLRHLGDPRMVANPLEELLSPAHARERLKEIRRALAAGVPGGALQATGPAGGDTTYLCAADREGNMVSFITSLSAKFGCGEVVEGTGILLNNRAGRGFPLDPDHPNVLAPGKRTMHTLLPVAATGPAGERLVVGTPGGDGQPQWNLQVLLNLVESGMEVQQAVDAPRWLHVPGTDPATITRDPEVRLEEGFPPAVAAALRAAGHRVVPMVTEEGGGAQVILARGGVYEAGSDPRVDGLAIGW